MRHSYTTRLDVIYIVTDSLTPRFDPTSRGRQNRNRERERERQGGRRDRKRTRDLTPSVITKMDLEMHSPVLMHWLGRQAGSHGVAGAL